MFGNSLKKYEKLIEAIFIMVLVSLPCIILFRPAFENDTFWLLNTGKYILNNGFPVNDPFTFHQGLEVSLQQWLSTVVFYIIYVKSGTTGLYIFTIALYYLITFIVYRICVKISNNSLISIFVTVFSSIFLSFYIVLRPQVFSIAIFAFEVYILECYVQTKRIRYLIVMPLLSLILINFHAAMWLFFFVIIAPYIVDGSRFKLLRIKAQGYGFLGLIVMTAGSVLIGILNPYGLKNMLYIFNSYGNDYINNTIGEMQSPDFKNMFGVLIFIMLITVTIVYSLRKGDYRLRYFLISAGTLYMGLSSIRSIPLFLVCASPFIAFYLKDASVCDTEDIWKKFQFTVVAIVIFIGVIFIKKYDFSDAIKNIKPEAAVEYLKGNSNLNDIVLFNDYETGGYLEFSGVRTFIDSRAEIFMKRINKKDDILIDYFKAIHGMYHYKDFISKYKFNMFLVEKNGLMDVYLKKDSMYEMVYQDDTHLIYQVSTIGE